MLFEGMYDQADTVWVLISTCLVFIMIPGLGYFYGGITRKHNKLTLLASSALGVAAVSVQWYIWGYSLSFSSTGSVFIGGLDNALFLNMYNSSNPLAPTIPESVYMIYQNMFAAITPCIAFGSAAERSTLTAYLIFLFFWSTLVYDFIAYWTWSPNGWLHDFGVIDFAGGTPVHVASGFSALVRFTLSYALVVGPRKTVNFEKLRPSSLGDIFLGTALLWFGWFGFNGGSELSINSRAVNAVVVTNLSGSVGGLTWMLVEMIKTKKRKFSLKGFCCGAISGFVCVTPASGYIRPHYAIVFGFLGAVTCLYACDITKLTKFRYDDTCDVFGVHGVGGFLGCILTGIFADKSVVNLDGSELPGGWINGNFKQVGFQLLSAVVAAVWAFVLTFLILHIINLVPFIRLKLNETEEMMGSDWVELGELANDEDVEKYEQEHFARTIKQSTTTKRESKLRGLKSFFVKKMNQPKNTIDVLESDPSTPRYVTEERNESVKIDYPIELPIQRPYMPPMSNNPLVFSSFV